MERGLANLSLDDGKDEAFPVPKEIESQSSAYSFCLVGCFLTASVIHFLAMRNTMVNLWHPMKGVQISDLGKKRFLFKFFNELDINRVITGHGDNFFPERLSHGMQEIELGCDLSLHAQPKRAITMNSIWLREEGEDNFFGKN
ncbi:hypothetical protein Gogos_021959 [Gossypium gossypioides]|uniref:DUF4283 domain-containing protein n=1 Tax=Gossypium gossypioides TaxID=34282 RepID=A0A7J9D7A3_GOSGO|nr:hypothetical protein [Gossypium gossypioides]